MTGYSIVARVSFGLAALTLSVLFVSYLLGLLPDTYKANQKGRQALAEAVAINAALAAQKNDTTTMKYILAALVKRNDEILSAGIRNSNGKLVIQAGDHARHWDIHKVGDPSLSLMRVPLYQGEATWGHVEIRFVPIEATAKYAETLGSLATFTAYPIIRLIFFVGIIAFVVYVFYMRRVLKHLDPSAVIPERVQAMLNTLSEGIIVLDNAGQIVLANDAFSKTVDIPSNRLIGLKASKLDWHFLSSGDEAEGQASRVYPWDKVIGQKDIVERNVSLKFSKLGGSARIFKVNATPIVGNDAQVRGVIVSFDDVTALERKNKRLSKMVSLIRQQNSKLQELATRDSLTGCLNRRAFFEILENAWSTAQRYKHDLSVLMVDVDHFKSVNDNHGHARGDEVLKEVSELLKSLCREHDQVCRYGGEEFCILIAFGSVEDSLLAAERYREAIAAKPIAGLNITASLGASSIDLGANNVQELINQADQALYTAKKAGRNRVVHWTKVQSNLAAVISKRSSQEEKL